MMSGKLLNLYSWPSIPLLICLFGHVQILHAKEYCQYQQNGQLGFAMKWCPNICCSSNRPRSENTTCCNPPVIYITGPTSTLTLFGYTWWTLFICAICLFIAISILCHYIKRMHILKHSKHFNSAVDPTMAFTISKSQLNLNLNDAGMISEQNPPRYSIAVSPPPPSYASVKA